jgi:hypothetical protein
MVGEHKIPRTDLQKYPARTDQNHRVLCTTEHRSAHRSLYVVRETGVRAPSAGGAPQLFDADDDGTAKVRAAQFARGSAPGAPRERRRLVENSNNFWCVVMRAEHDSWSPAGHRRRRRRLIPPLIGDGGAARGRAPHFVSSGAKIKSFVRKCEQSTWSRGNAQTRSFTPKSSPNLQC